MINDILHEIQRTLKAPKGQFNDFGKYHYRNAEDIVEAVKPLLPTGCTLTMSDKLVHAGNRYYIEATATLKSGEESVSCTALAREAETKKGMDEAQITGSASSYARKYALNGLFSIDDTKDADATNDHEKKKDVKEEKKPEELSPELVWKGKQNAITKQLNNLKTYEEILEWQRENAPKMKALELSQLNWINDQVNQAQERLTPKKTNGTQPNYIEA